MTRTLTFFALAALLAGGCRKGEAPSAPDVAETPAAADAKGRMQDPAYVAKLEALKEEQASLRRAASAAIRALDEAKEREAAAEEIAALEAAVARAKEALRAGAAKSAAMVAAQMRGGPGASGVDAAQTANSKQTKESQK